MCFGEATMKPQGRRTCGVRFLAALAVPTAAVLALSVVTVRGSGTMELSGSGSTAGECANVFGGEVCVSAVVTGDRALEVAVTVPMRTIEGAPTESGMVWPP